MVREFLAEFMSTYVMMVFGLGSVAHMVLGDKKFGSYLGVNLGFGFGVAMGVHVAGGISGAIDQFSGGELLVTGPTSTANIFATYLPEHMTLWWGFLDEVFLTGMLQLCIFAITDKRNSPALKGTEALVIGVLVCVIGISLGMNSGYAINPSRDLPPRFFTFIAGWGQQVFRAGDNWWWVPVVAPLLGAYLGGIVYLVFIHSSIPRDPQRLENSLTEDHKITVSTKDPPAPVSMTPASTQLAPPLSGSIPLEHF
ncbi:aquaporin-7 isoform X2 [Nannospalax galili]|uniref:aquaporin-7 isoform X2 n=1 Tax=Nannospalax galili TaxID=1026970 RepID=UPI00111C1F66|nr:aquaporin-7 isoform X2 [Nannospalax galili]